MKAKVDDVLFSAAWDNKLATAIQNLYCGRFKL